MLWWVFTGGRLSVSRTLINKYLLVNHLNLWLLVTITLIDYDRCGIKYEHLPTQMYKEPREQHVCLWYISLCGQEVQGHTAETMSLQKGILTKWIYIRGKECNWIGIRKMHRPYNTEINSEWIENLHVRSKSTKFLRTSQRKKSQQ